MNNEYDAIILAVAYDKFRQMIVADIDALGKNKHVLFDLKYILSKENSDITL